MTKVHFASGKKYLEHPLEKMDELLICYKGRKEYVVETEDKELLKKLKDLPSDSIFGQKLSNIKKYLDANNISYTQDNSKTTRI